jgi:beta-lactamase regulating signal transducer with metallopeptidase domain
MHTLMVAALSNVGVATLLAVLALIGSRLCPRRPAVAHALWLLVLLKLVTPPLCPVPIGRPSPAPVVSTLRVAPAVPVTQPEKLPAPAIEAIDPPADQELAPGDSGDPPQAETSLEATAEAEAVPPSAIGPEPLWPRALVGLWLLGSLSWFALAGWRLNTFRRLLRYAVPAPEAVRDRVEELAGRLGLSRCPDVRLLPGRLAPLLWAAGARPLLLLPKDLLERLHGDQLDALLTHELAHLRRRDHWVRWLELLVLGLYWWLPVAWLARRRLRAAEEECCDAWVVAAMPRAARAYATALVETIDFVSEVPAALPVLASGLGEVYDLKRRLTMILRGTTPRTLGWGGTLAVCALGLVALSLAPVSGRADDEQPPTLPPTVNPATPVDPLAPVQPPPATTPRVDPTQRDDLTPPPKQAGADLPAEIKDLQLQLAQAQAQVHKQQAELSAAQAQLAAVNARLRMRMADIDRLRQTGALPLAEKPRDDARPGVRPVEPPPRDRGTPMGSEQRIEELEKRLEQVLRELQELRREMKPRGALPARPGSTIPPATPSPNPAREEVPERTPTPR